MSVYQDVQLIIVTAKLTDRLVIIPSPIPQDLALHTHLQHLPLTQHVDSHPPETITIFRQNLNFDDTYMYIESHSNENHLK